MDSRYMMKKEWNMLSFFIRTLKIPVLHVCNSLFQKNLFWTAQASYVGVPLGIGSWRHNIMQIAHFSDIQASSITSSFACDSVHRIAPYNPSHLGTTGILRLLKTGMSVILKSQYVFV